MKRVKCGAFWIDWYTFDVNEGIAWSAEFFTSQRSRTPVSHMHSHEAFKTDAAAKTSLDKFIAAANRDNSLPVVGTVS